MKDNLFLLLIVVNKKNYKREKTAWANILLYGKVISVKLYPEISHEVARSIELSNITNIGNSHIFWHLDEI